MRRASVGIIIASMLWASSALAQVQTPGTRIPTPLRGTVTGFDFKCNGNQSYPEIEARGEREGWVDLRFTSKADGSIADITIRSLFGSTDFAEAAARALAKCRIVNPQQENGVAVDTANVPMRFFYRISTPGRTNTPGIAEKMQKVQSLLTAGDLDGAETLLDEVEAESTRIHEVANALLRRSVIMVKRGRSDIALRYVQQMPMNSNVIATTDSGGLLRTRLGIELTLGLVADAEETATKLEQEGIDLKGDPLLEGLNRLRAIGQSGQPLGVSGRIPTECRPVICDMAKPDWSYVPTHRMLSLTNVNGRVDMVSIRCNRKTYETKAAADVTWSVPAKWGNCQISVSGDPGTTFTLIDEMPPG
ncbi:TonB family protein [Niveispirillum sp.]|uniref:TonB family protein n=1 Tax=Niveispirillum sp. TaxID=1917217 RepID=UPI001B5849DE|nr:TonB family protein [Niveispirillum sp.]MBP7334961.1 TonB family protein [Niveispirillum sp.]